MKDEDAISRFVWYVKNGILLTNLFVDAIRHDILD
jgi:hypothetical protein